MANLVDKSIKRNVCLGDVFLFTWKEQTPRSLTVVDRYEKCNIKLKWSDKEEEWGWETGTNLLNSNCYRKIKQGRGEVLYEPGR